MRPIRSNSEISLFAARLETAYTEAVSLAERSAPYAPMNLWAVFPNSRVRQSMLRLIQGYDVEEPTPTPQAAPVAEPIPLNVRPPEYRRPSDEAIIPKPLKTAVALAAAALVAWLIFGHEQHLPDDIAPAASSAENDAKGDAGADAKVDAKPEVTTAPAPVSTLRIADNTPPVPKPTQLTVTPPANDSPSSRPSVRRQSPPPLH
ncbi:hypothetical protein BVER_05455 [Candidatus Burkholderia verschuerenii]|uniref:Uncharacterized protein n=1 Tax=Candidatus Burkholderia verschuerenii TaxID=242163 RepID=A0A0L0MD73_9BURK|nr:hypothetical protein [Candidatus Burkholderia verschuerenii]KND60637.1 hypothetical protein BVER_05455 [Candidatus Burkholderia verschuerenii]